MKNNRPTETPAALSSAAAFVIHVVDRSADSISGRIEHVHSGRAAYFSSLSEMQQVVRQTLDQLDQLAANR